MAKSQHRTTVDLPPDDLVKILTDPDFQVAREKAQNAIDASVKGVSRQGDRLVFEVHVTQHARTKTGIDRSRTEQAVTTYTWDLKARTASWVYRDPHSERVDVRGSVRVEPSGSGSTEVDDMQIEVRIPLLGGQIEKLILKEVEKGWPRYEAVLRKFAAKAKG